MFNLFRVFLVTTCCLTFQSAFAQEAVKSASSAEAPSQASVKTQEAEAEGAKKTPDENATKKDAVTQAQEQPAQNVSVPTAATEVKDQNKSESKADYSRGFGLSAGIAAPYLAQLGLHFKASNWLSVSVGYGNFTGDVGVAKVSLSMPEAIIAIHPFLGSFFIGAGMGQEKLTASATDSTTGLSAKVDVTATTSIVKMGWMWGFKTPGMFMGMDISYINPSGSTVTVTAPGLATTTSAYKDVQDAGKTFAQTAYPNITLLRFGYMF